MSKRVRGLFEKIECVICYEAFDGEYREPIILDCDHTMCRACHDKLNSKTCPMCRAPSTDSRPNYALKDARELELQNMRIYAKSLAVGKVYDVISFAVLESRDPDALAELMSAPDVQLCHKASKTMISIAHTDHRAILKCRHLKDLVNTLASPLDYTIDYGIKLFINILMKCNSEELDILAAAGMTLNLTTLWNGNISKYREFAIYFLFHTMNISRKIADDLLSDFTFIDSVLDAFLDKRNTQLVIVLPITNIVAHIMMRHPDKLATFPRGGRLLVERLLELMERGDLSSNPATCTLALLSKSRSNVEFLTSSGFCAVSSFLSALSSESHGTNVKTKALTGIGNYVGVVPVLSEEHVTDVCDAMVKIINESTNALLKNSAIFAATKLISRSRVEASEPMVKLIGSIVKTLKTGEKQIVDEILSIMTHYKASSGTHCAFCTVRQLLTVFKDPAAKDLVEAVLERLKATDYDGIPNVIMCAKSVEFILERRNIT